MHLYRSQATRRDSPFSRHFLRVMVHLSFDQDVALTVRIRDLSRTGRLGGLQVSPPGTQVCMLPTVPRR
jgi:hypothetical protein